MENTQWEVVGKTKKNKQNGDTKMKISKEDKTKFMAKAPKLEELKTATDTKFSVLDRGESKPVETKKEKVVAPVVTASPKKSEKQKPSKPKDIVGAITQLNHNELYSFTEELKKRFPGKTEILLDELAGRLNSMLAFESSDSTPMYLDKPASFLPGCLNKETKKYLELVFRSLENKVLEKFFLVWIRAMAQDIAKNRPVSGYRLLLSFLLCDKHSVDEAQLNEVAAICDNHKNNPKVVLPVFWAICNAGTKDLKTGMNVWRLVLCNFLHLKNYSKIAVDFLSELLNRIPEDNKKSYLTPEDYFRLFDQIYPRDDKSQGLPTATHKTLMAQLTRVKNVAYGKREENLRSFFLPYLERLTLSTSDTLRIHILDELVECLRSDSDCYKIWENQFRNYVDQSALLLSYLIAKQHRLPASLIRPTVSRLRDECREVLESSKEQPAHASRFKKQKKLPEGFKHCLEAAEKLLDASPSLPPKKKSSGLGKWNFTLLAILASIVYYDTVTFGLGKFEDSRLGLFLQDSGLTNRWNAVSNRTSEVFTETQKHLEEYYPEYYKPVQGYAVAGWNAGAKAVAVAAAYGSCGYEWLVQNIPVGVDKVEATFPGTKERVSSGYAYTVSFIKEYASLAYETLLPYGQMALARLADVSALAVVYIKDGAHYAVPRIQQGADWVKKDVFGSNASWEELRGDLLEASRVLCGKLHASYHGLMHKLGLCSGH